MEMNYTRTLTDGGTGFRYETKMAALIALRLNNHFHEFYLASNLRSGEKFDDIVFSIAHEDEWKTWFIQLKHHQPSTLDTRKITVSALRSKNELGLKQYFESYKLIAKKFNVSDDPIFGKSFSDVKFAIFTNSILHEEIANRRHDVFEWGFLSTNAREEKNIRLDLNTDKDILEHMLKDWYVADFVDRFYLFTRQACEDALEALIHTEIKAALPDLNNAEIKLSAYEWMAYIQKWAARGVYLLKEEAQRILGKIAKEARYGKRNDVSIKFIESFCNNEREQYGKQRLLHLVNDGDSTLMNMAALTQMGFLREPNLTATLRYITDDDNMQQIMVTWLRQSDIALVVDCEGDNLGVDKVKVASFLRDLVDVSQRNRVVLVSTKNNATATDISFQLKAVRRKFNCTLKNLNDESKTMLKEREVDFQGYKTTLASLMPTSQALDDVFDMVAMSQLLQGRLIKVGIKPIEHIPYYVTRELTRRATVTQALFTNPDIDACFALDGISKEEAVATFQNEKITASHDVLSGNDLLTQKIVTLGDDPFFEFQELAERATRPLHWFERTKKDSKLWQWKASTSEIHAFTNRMHTLQEFVPTDTIMSIKEKMVVITAEPGMGKSTLLEHLAAETKEGFPHVWVIYIPLNDYTEHFDKPDFIENIKENTRKLVAAAAGVDKETSKFDVRLFNQCYDVTGNMIVLLDGLDEITPYYTKQGIAFLRTLQSSPISRVWITARPILKDLLEDETATISYTIKPFSVKDQKTFLRKFWKYEIPDIDDQKLKTCVAKVLELISKSFDKKLDQFTGIPLQTRMIAEVFRAEIKLYHETGNMELSQTVDGVLLFDEFVSIKRGIQMEKSKVTVSNASARYEQRRLNEQRELELMKLALLTLLPRQECLALKPPITIQMVEQLKQLVNEGQEKSGIVLSFKGEFPQFIHRTFAEYFVAMFFTKNYVSNRRFMSADKFFSLPFEFVKYFFDNMLAAGLPLHGAVLRRDNAAVQLALLNGAPINGVDGGGRTALHLAAGIPDSQEVISMLLAKNANTDILDAVLDGRPVDYAFKIGAFENVVLLGSMECNEEFSFLGIPLSWKSLQLAVQGDNLNLFKHLMKNGIMELEPFSNLSPQQWLNKSVSHGLTILHLIGAFNADKISNHLLLDDEMKGRLSLFIEHKCAKGLTPIIQAASAGHLKMARKMMEAGADPLATSPDGRNLAAYAVENHDVDLLFAILSVATQKGLLPEEYLSGAITALIADTSDWGYQNLKLLLVEFPELMSIETTKKMSLLFAAVTKGNEKVVSTLCDLGADVNEKRALGTPLHYAISGGCVCVAEALLSCPRIEVNAADEDGSTPLYKAAARGADAIFQMLIASGASTGVTTSNGSDLTHAVALSGNETIFNHLLEHDFSFVRPNNFGKTAFSMLKEHKFYKLVKRLDPSFEIPVVQVKNKATKQKKNANPLVIDEKCSKTPICPLTEAFNNLGIGKNNVAQHSSSDNPPVVKPLFEPVLKTENSVKVNSAGQSQMSPDPRKINMGGIDPKPPGQPVRNLSSNDFFNGKTSSDQQHPPPLMSAEPFKSAELPTDQRPAPQKNRGRANNRGRGGLRGNRGRGANSDRSNPQTRNNSSKEYRGRGQQNRGPYRGRDSAGRQHDDRYSARQERGAYQANQQNGPHQFNQKTGPSAQHIDYQNTPPPLFQNGPGVYRSSMPGGTNTFTSSKPGGTNTFTSSMPGGKNTFTSSMPGGTNTFTSNSASGYQTNQNAAYPPNSNAAPGYQSIPNPLFGNAYTPKENVSRGHQSTNLQRPNTGVASDPRLKEQRDHRLDYKAKPKARAPDIPTYSGRESREIPPRNRYDELRQKEAARKPAKDTCILQ